MLPSGCKTSVVSSVSSYGTKALASNVIPAWLVNWLTTSVDEEYLPASIFSNKVFKSFLL